MEESIINSLVGIKENTKKNYLYKTRLLKKSGINFMENDDSIINKLQSVRNNYKKNVFVDLITVIVVLRKHKNLPLDKLRILRRKLMNENLKELSDTNKNNIILGLPTKEYLYNYLEYLYSIENYKRFIINYLIITYNVRNKDLDLTIIDNDKDLKELNSKNYILLGNSRALYVRNDYKTFKKYGTKKHIITDKKMIECLNKFLLNSESGKLLNSKVSINLEIIKSTVDMLGEGRIFKALLKESTPEQIKVMYQNRGSSLNTVFGFYVN